MASSALAEYLGVDYDEVDYHTFYRELFPQGQLEQEGESGITGKYNAIAIRVFDERKPNNRKAFRYLIHDDLEQLDELISSKDFIIVSPLSYCSNANTQRNAREMFAICLDLDGVIWRESRPVGLIEFFYQVNERKILPKPTYLVASGTGLHVYYFLQRPIPLYPNVVKQIVELRNALINLIWNRYVTSLHDNIQHSSYSQGFRAVGSICKDGKTRVRAFRTGEPVSIEYLNGFVPQENQVKEFAYKSELTLDEAKEKYPEWYQKRIVEKRPVGSWKVSTNLYQWWLRKIKTDIQPGHRYFGVFALTVFATKCGIPYEELETDALELVDYLDGLTIDPTNQFTIEDCYAALSAYGEGQNYIRFPRETIERLTAVEMPPNKRNYRKQEQHLKLARGRKRDLKEIGELKQEGRPDKKDLVINYYKEHPTATQREIAAALGISKTTVNHWVKYYKETQSSEGEQ